MSGSEIAVTIESSERGMVVLGLGPSAQHGSVPANTLVDWLDGRVIVQAGSQ